MSNGCCGNTTKVISLHVAEVSPPMRLIVNGKAASSPELRTAVNQLREKGHCLEVRVTWEGGDAARLAQEAQRDNVEVVIAAGGDGTINEVVTGLMQSADEPNVAVGVVPFGTANDFAHGCGIPIGDPLAALELILSTKPTPIDVACCNDRYFLNVASGGFGAEVTAGRRGIFAYGSGHGHEDVALSCEGYDT